MKRTFEMVEKSWEYRTDGYIIKKGYDRVNRTRTGHCTLDRYGWEQTWTVYPDPDKDNRIYIFHTLKEAKQYIIDKEGK